MYVLLALGSSKGFCEGRWFSFREYRAARTCGNYNTKKTLAHLRRRGDIDNHIISDITGDHIGPVIDEQHQQHGHGLDGAVEAAEEEDYVGIFPVELSCARTGDVGEMS